MKQFKNKYIEDSTELLSDLENDLLILEKNPNNSSIIEKVFRAMHSLKGVSGMYGFDIIGDYTHHLENIYDLIRDGKISVSKSILDITFASVDHIRDLLNDEKLQNAKIKSQHQELTERIIKIIEETTEADSNVFEKRTKAETEQDPQSVNFRTYYIIFTPNNNIQERGINIRAIFDELNEFGECKVIPHNRIKKAGEKFYMLWEIYIATDKSYTEIEDVFMFVEFEVEINTLSQINLLRFDDFVQHIEPVSNTPDLINLDELKEFAKTLSRQYVEKETAVLEKASGKVSEHVISSIRVSSDKLDELMNLVSVLVTTKAELSLLAEKHNIAELQVVTEKVDKLTRRLRDNALEIRLVPIEEMIVKFRRLIRDLSGELNKEVEFITEGTDTELDKTIIDNLSNPLMHILRNSIDHGIELPEERAKKGKAPKGIIKLNAYHSGVNVFVRVHDDGAGINLKKVRDTAIRKGLIQPDTELSEKEMLELTFRPGFSTVENVSEVSGRGVGMDVVNRRISEIRGEIEIETESGKGTTFTIKLPQTLSIVDTLLVTIEDNYYLIPLAIIDNCSLINKQLITEASNKRIIQDGDLIPFVYLRELFEYNNNVPDTMKAVIIKNNENCIAIIVDEVVGEHQAVIKPLGEVFTNQDILSGASILGDGSLALVLDINKLIKQL